MTLRHFQIFIAVCDHLNMTAAANALFMSQPAVSQAIAELEQHYDVRLFERLARKLYLTDAGEKLLGYARHILRMHSDAEAEMRSLNHNSRLRIGVSVTIGAYVLPKLVSSFKQLLPNVSVEVVEDNTTTIEKLIMGDKLDLGLVEGDLTLADLISKSFAEDTLVLICGKTHPFSKRLTVAPKELEHEEFILRELGSGTRNTFESAMAVHDITWRATWTCHNTETIKMAVAEGLGVSVISRSAVNKELEAGMLHIVDVEGITFKRLFKLVHHKNKFISNTMEQFITFCIKQFEA